MPRQKFRQARHGTKMNGTVAESGTSTLSTVHGAIYLPITAATHAMNLKFNGFYFLLVSYDPLVSDKAQPSSFQPCIFKLKRSCLTLNHILSFMKPKMYVLSQVPFTLLKKATCVLYVQH